MHQEVNRIMGSPSGIGAIHSPWARIPLQVLDTIGQVVAPKLEQAIPGTEGHHQALIRGGEGVLNEEEKRATEEAQQEKLGAETENQRAEAVKNAREPQPKEENEGKTITTDQGIMGWNPQTKRYDVPMGKPPAKEHEEEEGKTIVTDQGIMGWNPQTKKYDIPMGKSPAPKSPKETSEEQDIADYMANHPGAKIHEAREKTRIVQPREPADHGQNFIDPATGQLVRVEPGQVAPPGALSPGGFSTTNTPTMTQRTAAGRAGTVVEMAPEVMGRIDSMKDKLGPVFGRWNEFMQGKVGLDNPDFAALRADLLMMSSAVALAHAQGRLPENLRQEFDHAINSPKQTPENLKAIITTIVPWLKKMQEQVHPNQGSAQQQGGGPPKIATKADFDKLPSGSTYIGRDGGTYKKP
jgi:hypothetical protein